MGPPVHIPEAEAEEEVRRPFLLPWDLKLGLPDYYEGQRNRVQVRQHRDDPNEIVQPLAISTMPGHIPLWVKCHPVCPQRVANEAKCKDSCDEVGCSDTNCGPGGDVPAGLPLRRQNATIQQEYRDLGAACAAERQNEVNPCDLGKYQWEYSLQVKSWGVSQEPHVDTLMDEHPMYDGRHRTL